MDIEEYKIKFGKRLRELREERKNDGFTQEYLSDKLDCDTKKISTMENGTSAPKFEDLFILAELFNVNFDYLMGISNHRRVFKVSRKSEAISIPVSELTASQIRKLKNPMEL